MNHMWLYINIDTFSPFCKGLHYNIGELSDKPTSRNQRYKRVKQRVAFVLKTQLKHHGISLLVKKAAKRQRASNAPSPLFLAAEDIGDLQTVQTMKRAKGRKEGRQERYRNREKDPFIGQLKQGIGVAWNRQEVGHP